MIPGPRLLDQQLQNGVDREQQDSTSGDDGANLGGARPRDDIDENDSAGKTKQASDRHKMRCAHSFS